MHNVQQVDKQKSSFALEQLMYLPEDKNSASSRGKETESVPRKLDEFIEKFFIPCVTHFIRRESQIS